MNKTPTSNFADRFRDTMEYREWPTGETVSTIGFGCYRVQAGNETHEAALKKALESGINLIDTSTNYGDGKSEELVGKVLKDFENNQKRITDGVMIVTKVGYVQGQNLHNAKQREFENNAYEDMVKYGEGIWHCIHPDFLKDQITESLKRLQLEKVDVVLLHNPEYYLDWASKNDVNMTDMQLEFYRRITPAFEYLEKEVKNGRIKYYGISSNTFPGWQGNQKFVSLEKCWHIAREIGGRTTHHFKVAQMPFNLLEHGAATELNQDNRLKTVLDLAREAQIMVLINRPLNAITEDCLVRLADHKVNVQTPDIDTLKSSIQNLVKLEGVFYSEHLPKLEFHPQDGARIREYLAPGAELERHWKSFKGIEHWHDVRDHVLKAKYAVALDALTHNATESLNSWINQFLKQTDEVFKNVDNYYAAEAAPRNQKMKQCITDAIGKDVSDIPLSQLAVGLLKNTPGVACVLVGARREEYVDDVLKAAQNELPECFKEEWAKLAQVAGVV
jgi:aryl-alcohol dehydrogenase-like predicted oxidoreductase